MKRLFLVVVACLATVYAQGQTATLQQGDTMTPFYGEDAFVQAYNAAKSDAVIILSSGSFNTVDSITKQVTIIGNGSNVTQLKYKNIRHGGSEKVTNLIIKANNVKIEGASFPYGLYMRNVTNTLFRNCKIQELHATNIHSNTILDQCRVTDLYALNKAENMCIKNSFILYLYGGENTSSSYKKTNTTSNPVTFINCAIREWYSFYKAENYQLNYCYPPKGVYRNCILGQLNYSDENIWSGSDTLGKYQYYQHYNISIFSQTGCDLYNNVFFLYPRSWVKTSAGYWSGELNEDLKTKEPNLKITTNNNTSSTWAELFNDEQELKCDIPYMGDDGTMVGPYGGTGFSSTPNIPRIVESEIDSSTDAEGKLNVRIKVELNN